MDYIKDLLKVTGLGIAWGVGYTIAYNTAERIWYSGLDEIVDEKASKLFKR